MIGKLLFKFGLVCRVGGIVLITDAEIVFPGILVWSVIALNFILGILSFVLGCLVVYFFIDNRYFDRTQKESELYAAHLPITFSL